MDVTTMTQLIGTVGFPICVSLYCLYYMNKQNDKVLDITEKTTDAINNNTFAIQALATKLGINTEG